MITLGFIYFFLPIFLIAYYLTPRNYKFLPAIFACVLFISYVDVRGLLPLGISVLSAYAGGVLIGKRIESGKNARPILAAAVLINLAVYLIFHRTVYDGADFLTSIGTASFMKSAVFIGAAVFPLNAVSYCVDIYRGKYKFENSLAIVSQYIAFFPTVCAGPLLKFNKVRDKIARPAVTFELAAKGVRFFCLGLFRKVLLSNTMLELWNNIREVQLDSLPTATAWIGMLAFAFFMYFEVSSFSYMAVGLGALMGFDLPINFNRPYTAYCFKDFVKRFNSTLYRWAHDYVYKSFNAPGSGKANKLISFVLAVVFAALWYGFSIRCYLFAAAIVLVMISEKALERPLRKLPKFIRRIMFLLLLMFILPLLALPNPNDAVSYIFAMLGANTIAVDMLTEYLIKSYLLFIIVCIVISGGIFSYFFKRNSGITEYFSTIAQPVWVIALLLICTAFIVSGDNAYSYYMF